MRRKLLAVIAVAIPGTLAACGGGNSGGGSPTTQRRHDARHARPGSRPAAMAHTLSIGSKSFAEEQLMAQMTEDVLEAHGFTVTYTFSAADKAIGKALTSGTIDMYWQYTGTELTDYLGLQTGSFPTALGAAFTFVQQTDEAHGLCWVAPTQFDDTNGIAIKQSQTPHVRHARSRRSART